MVKITRYFLLFSTLSYLSCGSVKQRCENECQEILVYQNISVDIEQLIPCQRKFKFNNPFKSRGNMLQIMQGKEGCKISINSLKKLSTITGYEENGSMDWEKYKVEFSNNFSVKYEGSFLHKKTGWQHHIISVFSKNSNVKAVFVKELYLLTESKNTIVSIVKINTYSDYLPDYAENSHTIYNGKEFVYLYTPSLTTNFRKIDDNDICCANYRFNENGQIIPMS